MYSPERSGLLQHHLHARWSHLEQTNWYDDNLKLRCYVTADHKIGEFRPKDAGKRKMQRDRCS